MSNCKTENNFFGINREVLHPLFNEYTKTLLFEKEHKKGALQRIKIFSSNHPDAIFTKITSITMNVENKNSLLIFHFFLGRKL